MRAVGKELGARYVMEGSLRQAGSTLRLAVQVVDAVTGAHLWAETYERPFRPEDVFALQDDLVPRIVSTVADWYGVLPRSMSDAVRSKAAEELSPYEAVLRSFGYFARFTPEEHAAVRAGLERAVEQAPGYADAWAMLSMIYGEEYRFRFNVGPDPLGRALHAARRAADASPSNHLVHLALAQALFFRKEFPAFRNAAERAIALNPMDGSTVEYMAHLMAFAGDWEQGCRLAEQARQLNPNHPGWYWAVGCLDAYRKGEYRDALTLALKAQTGGASSFTRALLAAVYGQLGERQAAGRRVREVLALEPDFASAVRDEFGKWYLPGARRAPDRRPPQGGAATSRRTPERPAAGADAARAPATGSGAARARRGLLGRRAAVQVHGRQRRSHGAGRGAVRGDRHRAVALLVPPRDRAQLDDEVRRRGDRRARRRQGARCPLRHGGEPAPGGIDSCASPVQLVDAAPGPPVGRDLRPAVSPGRGVRAAGRSRAADRLHGGGHERRAAAQR